MYLKLKRNKKGFTLAELLIVVAIIAILVAIAIPLFSAQMDRAKATTWEANARSVHAEALMAVLTDDTVTGTTYTFNGTFSGVSYAWSYDTTENFATVKPSGGTFNNAIALANVGDVPYTTADGYQFDVSSGGTLATP